MKTLITKQFRLLFLLPLLTTGLFAQEENDKKKYEFVKTKNYEFVKTKNISETYELGRGGGVYLDNQFGDVKINVWNGNQVKLNISAQSSSNNEAFAQHVLDKMEFIYGKTGNDVNATTRFGPKSQKWNGSKKGIDNSMAINYEVFVPAWALLDIKNQFGDVVVPDYSGELKILNQFGDLKAGSLTNAKKVEVKFGQADIKSMNGGELNIEFASDPVVLQNISGNTEITIRFCAGGVYLYAANNLSALVQAQHSKLNLIADKSFAGKLAITTNFGSFENKSGIEISKTSKDEKYGPQHNNSYESKSGSGNGVTIKGSFADVVVSNQKETFSTKKRKTSKASADDDKARDAD